MDPSCRGKGIGTALFQSFLDYLREHHLHSFYLYTDTSCNYGFYKHQGMKRRYKKSKSFHIKGQDAKMHFFIYDKHLSS
ncbi:GNAT family N-acetyltransferase [Mediterraneibacter gnavus]|uniref:GNAT family N-acetyltransferase n=1 Tax=Mediterraneibacter gnavus TaxID=33038 RepID=UPI0004B4326E|nr:GNAT family N-acetyltransferase [Mediterraneibacter gnavus]